MLWENGMTRTRVLDASQMTQMACPLKARNCPFGCGVKECSHPSQYALKTHAPLLGNVKMETTHFKEASLSVSNTTP